MSDDFEVGPQYGGTGSHNNAARVGISGAQIISDAHGHFFEANRLGMGGTGDGLLTACTGAAGVAPGTALSTTPPFAIWNPPNSGVVLAIAVARLGLLSGTLGVGSVFAALVEAQTAKPSGGTQLTVLPALVGNQSAGRGQAFQGATLSGTPVALQPLFAIGANPTGILKDILDSEIIVLPGGVFVMQEIGAAGTSPLAFFGATWEEIPYLL